MTIDQAIAKLKEEKLKGLTSRFACRAIMVRNIAQYCELLDKLYNLPGIEFVSSYELFPEADKMPRYERLTAEQYKDRWVVLTGVSEYLRLFSHDEASSQRFAKLWCHHSPADSLGRVIIPLWGCEAQWHDRALHLDGDIRQEEFYLDCVNEDVAAQHMKITVLSETFEQYSTRLSSMRGQLIFGLQDWYNYWAKPSPDIREQVLLTACYRSIQSVTGDITIHVIGDTLSFIQENMKDGGKLTKSNCPEEAQECLFDAALDGQGLDQSILSCLNISTFSGLDVMGRWSVMSQGEKQLVKLWLQLHPDDSYLCHCFIGTKSFDEVEKRILHEVFAVRNTHPSWVAESQKLITAMGLIRNNDYYEEVDKIPEYAERLSFLSGDTSQDRVYLLHMVGRWLREDPNQVHQSTALQKLYPALFAYLDGEVYPEDLRRYLGLYKSYKLANTLPDDEETYFAGIQPADYDFRYPRMADAIKPKTTVLWIDALGAEWLPLLLWSLKQCSEGIIKEYSVAKANLPTETVFNKQWEQMPIPYEKLDYLDKLAHKGVIDDPDYYVCVEDQISFIVSVAEKITGLLKNNNRVIVTGDHGTSRLAARFFHKRAGIALGKNGKVCSHGRYAQLTSDSMTLMSNQVMVKGENDDKYVVFTNYDHFTQSGFAAGVDDDNAIYGEVHGGATPEEMLVPVVVIERKEALPLAAAWKKNPVKISKLKVNAALTFSQDVTKLQVSIGSNMAVCSAGLNKDEWSVTFSDLKKGSYQVSVVADGKLIHVEALDVLPAIESGGGDFDF